MVKKGKKRSLEGTEGSVKTAVDPPQPVKKSKIAANSDSAPKLLPKTDKKSKKPKTQLNGVQKPRIIENVKLDKKNVIKVEKKLQSEQQQVKGTEEKKKKTPKVKKEKETQQKSGPVKKEKKVVEKNEEELSAIMQKKVEAKKKKKELRKQARLENGQYKPENINLTEEQIKTRIEEINSKGPISRTARRRLAVLKKKLKILEGTYTPNPPVKKMSESVKRKIRRQKRSVLIAEMKENEAVTDAEKQKNLEEKAKHVAKLIKEEKKTNVKSEDKKLKGNKEDGKKGKQKGIKVEVESDDDDDDDDVDEETEEEEEGEGEEEKEVEEEEEEEEESGSDDSTLNTSAAAADQNDDDDDDDDEEETEEQPKALEPPKKIQKPVVNKVKFEKAEKNSQQEKQTPEKKTRYVLFVGNLPFTATTENTRQHFLTKVNEVSSVRIPLNATTNKPRGFAYVEFPNSIEYEKALSLHESDFQGRRIRVQYSESGSKKAGSKPSIVAKNQKLHALRKQGKLAGSVKDSNKRNFRRNKQKSQGA